MMRVVSLLVFALSAERANCQMVWSGAFTGANAATIRYAPDGTLVDQLQLGSVSSMALVDGEVWVGRNDSEVLRLRANGDLIGFIATGQQHDAILQVGDEVWIGAYTGSNAPTVRLSLSGETVGSYSFGNVSAMALVGGEVWVARNDAEIARMSFDGQVLGTIATGQQTDAIAVVGSEVWLARYTGSAPTTTRYTLAGQYLGSHSLGNISAMTVVGHEVWAGREDAEIARIDFSGNVQSVIATGRQTDALLFVPCPGSALPLLAASAFPLTRRNRPK